MSMKPLRGLITVDEFQLDEPIVSRENRELVPPEDNRFPDLFFGNQQWKGLLPVKIEQVEIEEEVLFLNTLEFDADLVEFQFLIPL